MSVFKVEVRFLRNCEKLEEEILLRELRRDIMR